jgi:hypothetical protein
VIKASTVNLSEVVVNSGMNGSTHADAKKYKAKEIKTLKKVLLIIEFIRNGGYY